MSVKLTDVTKRYGEEPVVDRVSLQVEQGELFVLLGASGSGKSTILRLVAGLVDPDEGAIELLGRDVTHLPPQARQVGLVPQSYCVFRHMSVAENVEFGLRIRGVDRATRAAKRDELLELVELGGLGERRPHELSGGQLQRVALARALAYEPRVLLLDEPFGALDVKIRSQLRRSLVEAQRRVGVTTLLVTHDQEEAFQLADRIAVVEGGRILEVGTAQELYARPRKGWTAGFVGAGCVFLGRVTDGRAHLGPLSLEVPDEAPHEEGGWVRVLVRPEQFALSDTAPAAGVPTLGQGEVIGRDFTGPTIHVRVRIPRQSGMRQLSPVPPFGEEGLVIGASVLAGGTVPDQPWVSLTGWHVLEQPPPRLLVHGGEEAANEPFVEWLRRALGATSVTTVDPAAKAEGAQPPDRRRRFYDMTVRVIEPSSSDVLEEALARELEAPLLILRPGTAPGGTVLACTAVGESGKSDIRVAGWLARRLEERVTLLHVWTRRGEPPAWLTSHLKRGLGTLRAQGAEPELVVKHARTALDGILEQLAAERTSLVVVGASPPAGNIDPSEIFALHLARATAVPVLVVPQHAI